MKKNISIIIFLLITNIISAQTINYNYDSLGRLTQITYPDNSVIKYAYDASGNRISMTMAQTAALALNFISFTVRKQNNNSLLQWQTADESGTSYFNIERGTGGRVFITIDKVNSNGSNHYNYLDTSVSTLLGTNGGTVYYQLKAVNKDNSSIYSNVESITFSGSGTAFNIYPNPAGNTVTIKGNGIKQLRLIDNSGKLIINKTVNGNTVTSLDISNLAIGMYYIIVTDIDGNNFRSKLVKEK
jgi:YD repeat-containing protein